MKQIIFSLSLSMLTFSGWSQNFWKKEDPKNFIKSIQELHYRKSVPKSYEIYSVDMISLSRDLKKRNKTVVQLPNGNGKLHRFRVVPTSNLAPELAAKFPMIHSYTGYGIDDPTAIAKLDIGTKGFHAWIVSGTNSTLYIDPYTKDGTSSIVYFKKNIAHREHHFMCEVKESLSINKGELSKPTEKNADDGLLRTFRIAIAATGEYSQYHINDQGINSDASDVVKKAAVLSAMNTTMNRVNGVFEKDLGVRMEIVVNNDQIIFLDAATDGLSNNAPAELIGQSQSVCDSQIGSANYDVGHTFSTGGGGLAGLGVVCADGQKAFGITGLGVPINDPFDIDYVSHELGHQFGANHTQNNSCNRNNPTAIEPGSASTIMGYAGICVPNVQSNSDDYFHTVSIVEMWNVLQNTGTCAVTTNTGNSAPTANAGPDVSIPRSTPFVLRGTATDVDGLSSLTYNWEQIDHETGAMPPSTTSTQGPMFRSLPSKSVPERYMPDLSTVVAGNISSTWEVVPSVARDMEFAFTVRDNHPGGGNSARDDKVVTIVDVIPFVVSSQATSETYTVGDLQTVTWEKGSTHIPPINCQLINIKLSTDGGLTFPVTVISNTPNDGAQEITIPDYPTTTARIMVEAADHIFYNVNTTNFSIEASSASVDENMLRNFSMYPNPTKGLLTLRFDTNLTSNVHIQLYDLRGRNVQQFLFDNSPAVFNETIDIGSFSSGIYLIKIQHGNQFTVKKLIIE